ncbi:NADAR domain-containing protein [Catenulispora pinistramenti]|uniref:NADAR domain-containing protein n=1 Tax=Catenulispora pinistramenti TaxID=2705254 RepID=UPI0039B4774E
MAVFIGNVAKFHQNPALGDFLAATRTRALVEASPYDQIWGIGLLASDLRHRPGQVAGTEPTGIHAHAGARI